MKINDKKRLPLKKGLINLFQSDSSSVSENLETKEATPNFNQRLLKHDLDELKQEILKQGLKFLQSPVYFEVKKYQLLLKDLVQWVQKNSSLVRVTSKEKSGGKLQTSQWLETIDKESKSLLEEMMGSQKQLIYLSDKIEKINGLIVNLTI